jgi:hypothetical protein
LHVTDSRFEGSSKNTQLLLFEFEQHRNDTCYALPCAASTFSTQAGTV